MNNSNKNFLWFRLILASFFAINYSIFTGYVLLCQLPLRIAVIIRFPTSLLMDKANSIASFSLVAICLNFILSFIFAYYIVYVFKAIKWYFSYLSMSETLKSFAIGGILYSIVPWATMFFLKSGIFGSLILGPTSMLLWIYDCMVVSTYYSWDSGERYMGLWPQIIIINFFFGGLLGHSFYFIYSILKDKLRDLSHNIYRAK